MPLPMQSNFFGKPTPVGDIEMRIILAYKANPRVADSDRLLILSVWQSEGLAEVLGDRFAAFSDWFEHTASSSESITRAGRKLRSQGLIKASPHVSEARRRLQDQHRRFWRGEAV
jgi:heme-degrading monooxygenase HmoA